MDDRAQRAHGRHGALEPARPADDRQLLGGLVSGSLIAQGWYDQGVRFLDVSDPTAIKQVGHYVNQGEFWAAYFAPSDPSHQVVYGLDVAGGIDVLKIDRSGAGAPAVNAPARAIARASTLTPHPTFRFACPLAPV